MKKIACLFFIFCLGLCFAEGSNLQDVIDDYYESKLKNYFPFLETFPFNVSKKECSEIKPEQFEKDYYWADFSSDFVGNITEFTLIENFAENFTFTQGSTPYTLYQAKYAFDDDGVLKIIYCLRTKTNFYWINDVLCSVFEIENGLTTSYYVKLFGFEVNITLDAEEKEDGYFYTTISFVNRNNVSWDFTHR